MEKDLKSRDVATEIRALARLHAVSYERGSLDDLADQITRLAGDEVELDEIELLLVALQRAEVISGKQATLMQAEYLRGLQHP